MVIAERGTLVERALAMHDRIAARRDETERGRMVPREIIEEMKGAGLFRALQSKHYGGLELPPAEWFAALVEISAACPSTGWIMGILSVHPFEFAQMSLEMQDELYRDDPNTLISSSYAPQSAVRRAPGGYRINGRHRSSSGVDHATWVVVGGVIPDESPETGARTFVIPQSDYSVIDDWHVMGLGGTGSKSVVFDDVFVPEHRSLSRAEIRDANGPGSVLNTNPLFKLSHAAIYCAAGSGPAIGAAKGAYREFLQQINGYVRRLDGKNKATDPIVQLHIAEAQSLVNNAEQRIMRNFADMYAAVCAGETIPIAEKARHVWDLSQAADDCVSAVREIFETRGASAVYTSNELQRYYRDVITMRQHGTQERDSRAVALAQAELGLPVEGAWL